MMMLKTLLLLSSVLLPIAQASADDYRPTGKPVSLHCQGAKGELTLEADAEKGVFRLALILDGKTHLIELDSPRAALRHASAQVTSTIFTYDDHNQDFIDIDASFIKSKWFGPTSGCMPTRAPDAPCWPFTRPGHWGSVSSGEVLVGIKPKGAGLYTLSVLRAESYGIADWHPLGEDATCEGSVE